jgi:hypothetical protein
MEIADDTAFWVGEKKYQCTKGVYVGNTEYIGYDTPPRVTFSVVTFGYEDAIERGLIAEVEPTELDLLRIRHRKEEEELKARLARKRGKKR